LRDKLRSRRPARQEQNPAKKFSFSFTHHTKIWCGGLEEKIGRAQIKKCEENFFAGWRASASGGGAERQNSAFGFSLKKVRISFSVRSIV